MKLKRFKQVFEDAPVNSAGVAVATNEPIVRKKKKKEDSSGREIGTTALLKRYKEDTPGQENAITESAKVKNLLKKVKGLDAKAADVIARLPMPVITSIINQMGSLVAGDDEHPPHVKDKEKEKKKEVLKGSLSSVNEARLIMDGKLVTTVDGVLDSIVKKLKSEMGKRYKRNAKDGIAFINSVARLVGMTTTDQKQAKGKLFLKLGESIEERHSDVMRKRTQSQQKAHQKAMMKSAKKSIKDYNRKNKNKNEEKLEEGLWDNIRKKRARGEKMRKKGEKGAPTQDQIKRAQEECCAECTGHYDHMITEAEYQGKKVSLNDPIRTSENPNKKFKVYVKGESGKVVVVRFGDPKMGINRDNPERRKSFRARHNCADPGPKWKARYWSCYQWRASAKVDS